MRRLVPVTLANVRVEQGWRFDDVVVHAD